MLIEATCAFQRHKLAAICQEGLWPGKPCDNGGDQGYFGDRTRGVYVTAFADYAMCVPSLRSLRRH